MNLRVRCDWDVHFDLHQNMQSKACKSCGVTVISVLFEDDVMVICDTGRDPPALATSHVQQRCRNDEISMTSWTIVILQYAVSRAFQVVKLTTVRRAKEYPYCEEYDQNTQRDQ